MSSIPGALGGGAITTSRASARSISPSTGRVKSLSATALTTPPFLQTSHVAPGVCRSVWCVPL